MKQHNSIKSISNDDVPPILQFAESRCQILVHGHDRVQAGGAEVDNQLVVDVGP